MEMKEYESFVIVKCKARSKLEASLRVNRMLESSRKDDDMTINHVSTAPTFFCLDES